MPTGQSLASPRRHRGPEHGVQRTVAAHHHDRPPVAPIEDRIEVCLGVTFDVFDRTRYPQYVEDGRHPVTLSAPRSFVRHYQHAGKMPAPPV